MAELLGSESQYSSPTGSRNQAQGAKPQAFGSTVVAPPISGPMQNIVPGSQEWQNARMAIIIEQLRKQYADSAARRGMLQSGSAEKEFEDAVAQAEQQVAQEAGQFTAQKQEAEAQRQHESKMAKEQAKSQETAAMYSGLGSMAPYAVFGKWGSDTPAQPVYTTNDKGDQVQALNPDGTAKMVGGSKAQSPMGSAWKYLTKTNPSVGLGMLGTGAGTMLSGSKNVLPSMLAGGAATALAGGNKAAAGLGSLGASMFLNANTLKKPFSGKNWWKTLLGAGSLAGAAYGGGLFGGGK